MLARRFAEYKITVVCFSRGLPTMAAATFLVSKVQDIMENKSCKMQIGHVNDVKVKKILRSLSSSRKKEGRQAGEEKLSPSLYSFTTLKIAGRNSL